MTGNLHESPGLNTTVLPVLGWCCKCERRLNSNDEKVRAEVILHFFSRLFRESTESVWI